MSNISAWSTTAASNNAESPNGFKEGMLPSGVNDSAREVMAAVRTWYEGAEWVNLGHTPTFVSTTSFTIPTDVTAAYHVGRRMKFTDATTLYGAIATSSYGAPDTTITVAMDSGVLSASLTAVSLGIISKVNTSNPSSVSLGVTAGSAVQVNQAVTAWTRSATTTLGTTLNGTLSDTSTTITAFNGVAGVTYHCRCLGAGAITHHATDLIITQTGASIAATATGDTFDVEMITSTTCRIKNYQLASGRALVAPAATTYVKFSAYKSSPNQALASATPTKITYDSEEYDVGSVFASSRFSPGKVGKFQLSAHWSISDTDASANLAAYIYKNGSVHKLVKNWAPTDTSSGITISVDVAATLDTDYFEVYARQDGGGSEEINAGQTDCWFCGHELP